MNILVVYVSKTGTTEEIARRIGEELRKKGTDKDFNVEVAPLASIASLKGYDKLVLGSPVNGMKVLPEFRNFLTTKVAGSGIPCDIFIVSYLFEHGRKMWRRSLRKDAGNIQALAGAGSVEIFGGRLSEPLPGFARFMFGTPANLPLDLRDWKKIDAWVEKIAEKI